MLDLAGFSQAITYVPKAHQTDLDRYQIYGTHQEWARLFVYVQYH